MTTLRKSKLLGLTFPYDWSNPHISDEALTENVHFLDCGEYRLGRVRFLGATLWTDFRLFGDDDRQTAMRTAEAVMVDYKRIRLASKGYRKLRAADTAQFHATHRSWLTARLAEPFDGKTVVITHMAPSMRSVAEEYAGDPASAAFASRLDDLVSQADVWVHGHMHDSFLQSLRLYDSRGWNRERPI